jgi:glycosyltransferase involved in cell wall biosynthesis
VNITVDIVIACKGRLHHLQRTLPSFLNQDGVDYRVIVVDYRCPDGTFDYVRNLNHPRLGCIRVEDGAELFSLPRAINIGVNYSRADIIVKVDADQLVEPDWLSTQIENIGPCGIVRPAVAGYPVSIGDIYVFHGELSPEANTYPGYCLTRRSFHAVRGIDEGFEGWGYEDADFCFRVLRRQGLDYTPFVPYRGAFLNHSEDDSVRFYAIKNKQESAAKNLSRLQKYDRSINPTGYGQTARYQLFNLPENASAAGAWDEYYRQLDGQVSYGACESYELLLPAVSARHAISRHRWFAQSVC